jgi:aspartyl-tRNA(Asn)/glutamyl-tRNA(Gln) amidotransferase subunit B
MRGKEEANDYRYFPDPDLLPVVLDDAFIESVRATLPELPDALRERFVDAYGLKEEDAATLTASREMAAYYEAVVATCDEPRMAANWVMVELGGALNRAGLEIAEGPVDATALGGLIRRIADQTISGKIAKQVFEAMWNGEGNADAIIEARGLKQVSDSGALEQLVDELIAANPQQVEQYRAGKAKLLGFFVGQAMKATKGQANPQQLNDLLRTRLGEPGGSE